MDDDLRNSERNEISRERLSYSLLISEREKQLTNGQFYLSETIRFRAEPD